MKKDIGERISSIRRDRGYTQDQLSEMAMLSRITLARYETGVIEPGALAISRIADALNVTTDELLCRTEKQPPFVQIVPNAIRVMDKTPEPSLAVLREESSGYDALPDGVSADYAIRCKDDSMVPTFFPGDLVLIRQQPDVKPGQIAAVGVRDETLLKRVFRTESNIVLCSENPAHAPQVFHSDSDIKIFGLAVGFVRLW